MKESCEIHDFGKLQILEKKYFPVITYSHLNIHEWKLISDQEAATLFNLKEDYLHENNTHDHMTIVKYLYYSCWSC